MNTISISPLKAFVQSQGFTQIVPTVRTNINDYPYLTFINANNEATNVYFSKAESEKVAEGLVLDKEYLRTLKVAEAINADGQLRHKLTTGSGDRLELDFL